MCDKEFLVQISFKNSLFIELSKVFFVMKLFKAQIKISIRNLTQKILVKNDQRAQNSRPENILRSKFQFLVTYSIYIYIYIIWIKIKWSEKK